MALSKKEIKQLAVGDCVEITDTLNSNVLYAKIIWTDEDYISLHMDNANSKKSTLSFVSKDEVSLSFDEARNANLLNFKGGKYFTGTPDQLNITRVISKPNDWAKFLSSGDIIKIKGEGAFKPPTKSLFICYDPIDNAPMFYNLDKTKEGNYTTYPVDLNDEDHFIINELKKFGIQYKADRIFKLGYPYGYNIDQSKTKTFSLSKAQKSKIKIGDEIEFPITETGSVKLKGTVIDARNNKYNYGYDNYLTVKISKKDYDLLLKDAHGEATVSRLNDYLNTVKVCYNRNISKHTPKEELIKKKNKKINDIASVASSIPAASTTITTTTPSFKVGDIISNVEKNKRGIYLGKSSFGQQDIIYDLSSTANTNSLDLKLQDDENDANLIKSAISLGLNPFERGLYYGCSDIDKYQREQKYMLPMSVMDTLNPGDKFTFNDGEIATFFGKDANKPDTYHCEFPNGTKTTWSSKFQSNIYGIIRKPLCKGSLDSSLLLVGDTVSLYIQNQNKTISAKVVGRDVDNQFKLNFSVLNKEDEKYVYINSLNEFSADLSKDDISIISYNNTISPSLNKDGTSKKFTYSPTYQEEVDKFCFDQNKFEIGDVLEFSNDKFGNVFPKKAVYLGTTKHDDYNKPYFYFLDEELNDFFKFTIKRYKISDDTLSLKDKFGLTDNNRGFFMNTFGAVSIKNTKEKFEKEKYFPSTIPIKKELTAALYRSAADTSIQLMQNSLASMISSNKDVKEILNSDIMNSVMRLSLGYGLTYSELYQENKHVNKISSELRQSGLSNAGNLIIENVILPALQEIFAKPEKENIRIADNSNNILTEENTTNEELHQLTA